MVLVQWVADRVQPGDGRWGSGNPFGPHGGGFLLLVLRTKGAG